MSQTRHIIEGVAAMTAISISALIEQDILSDPEIVAMVQNERLARGAKNALPQDLILRADDGCENLNFPSARP